MRLRAISGSLRGASTTSAALAAMAARLAPEVFAVLPLMGKPVDADAILASADWAPALSEALKTFVAGIAGAANPVNPSSPLA